MLGGQSLTDGKLLVNNGSGSGRWDWWLVRVNNGTLGGKGTIAGAVIMGIGGDTSEATSSRLVANRR